LDIHIIKNEKKIRLNNNIVLYKIKAKNYLHKFVLVLSLSYFIYNGIDIYEIIKNGKNIININKFYLLIFILTIVLLIVTLSLLFMKSKITNNLIILGDGIFKIDEINNIEKENKKIKIYFRKSIPYALLGYKTFVVKEDEVDEIFNLIKNKIEK
jgi:NhaP-type Na+/H+ or K+/H+ antiporter